MNDKYRNAVGTVESSNNYGAIGPVTKLGDRAYGRYQVMGANIPEWTQKHLGRSMTADEFLADKDAQDKVFDAETSNAFKKYGNLDDVTSQWFSGRPVKAAGNSSDGYNTVPQYIQKVNAAYGADPLAAINSAAGIPPTGVGALTSAFSQQDNGGILSPANTLGRGALFTSDDKSGVLAEGLTGIGSSLAGISNPAQAEALNQQLVAMKKTQDDAGSWSLHTMPNGQTMMLNNKSRETRMLPGNYAKPEDDTYQKQYKTDSAKGMVELDTGLSTAARDATNQQTTVEELKRAFSDPNLKQGIDGPMQQIARKAYVALGFGDPELAATAANGDMATALSNKLALQLVNSGGTKLLPGSFSDSDRKFVTQMTTSLSNDPAANQRLLDIYTRSNTRVQEAEGLRQTHADSNGGVLLPSFKTELNKLNQKWSEEDKARDAATPSPVPGKPKATTLPKGVKSIQLVQ